MYTNCVWVTLRLFPHFGIVSFDIDMKRKHWSLKFLFPNCIWVTIQMRIATDDSIVSADYGDYCERALRKTPIHWHEKNKLGDRLCVVLCWVICMRLSVCSHVCVPVCYMRSLKDRFYSRWRTNATNSKNHMISIWWRAHLRVHLQFKMS